jgi:uncharacterized protein (TIGR02453 family)
MGAFFYFAGMKNACFTDDFLQFFMDLAPNNNKDWFDLNRKRYLESVKKPFEDFVAELIAELKKSKEVNEDLRPSDCIFRINRDIRFSKDKTPYKLNVSASITKGGKKNMDYPGLYIELGPEYLGIYTGLYMPDKNQLLNIRNYIAKHLKPFDNIIKEKAFVNTYGGIQGEKSKILPSELKTAAEKQSLIYNKQFYVMHRAEPEIILDKQLLSYCLKQYRNASKLNDFIFKAL